jgi:hypothetical protein
MGKRAHGEGRWDSNPVPGGFSLSGAHPNAQMMSGSDVASPRSIHADAYPGRGSSQGWSQRHSFDAGHQPSGSRVTTPQVQTPCATTLRMSWFVCAQI